MIIKIGERVEHGGEQFVIVNIKHEQALGGKGLLIQCVDPETADHEQQRQMKVEQVNHGLIDLIKKAMEEGGKGGFGFIGGNQ